MGMFFVCFYCLSYVILLSHTPLSTLFIRMTVWDMNLIFLGCSCLYEINFPKVGLRKTYIISQSSFFCCFYVVWKCDNVLSEICSGLFFLFLSLCCFYLVQFRFPFQQFLLSVGSCSEREPGGSVPRVNRCSFLQVVQS